MTRWGRWVWVALLGGAVLGSMLGSVAAQPLAGATAQTAAEMTADTAAEMATDRATDRAACTDHEPVPWQALAPGIWVWALPAPAEVSAANGGHVMPTTVVLDGARALVIDPGPSQRHGERLKASLACRFAARVSDIVNTHAHSENVLANSAFAPELAQGRLRIWALDGTRQTMAQRCPACLESLTEHVGEAGMRGTQIVLPSHTLVPGQPLVWGGRRWEVLAPEAGHSLSDLRLWLPDERLLWAGGLVYGERVPELAQGSLDAWLQALERIAALRPLGVVGVGVFRAPPTGALPEAIGQTRDYLQALRDGVWRAMDAGDQPQQAGLVPLAAFSGWVGYRERHGFNVLRAWRELEPVWMAQPEPTPR